MKNNKKSAVSYLLVRIIIIVLTFIILLGFVSMMYNKSNSESDKLACLYFIKTLDTINDKSFGAGELLIRFKDKCKVNYLKIDNKDKSNDEIFKEIADEALRTWEKYGAGKYEFMNNFKTQNWCFLSSIIEFKEKNGVVYRYNDLIDWMCKNKFDNGTKKVKYIDGINILTFNKEKEEEYLKIKDEFLKEIMNFQNENDGLDEFEQNLLNIYAEQYINYENLRLKKIDTNEKLYIVYIYKKPNKEFSEKISDAVKGGVAFTVGGIILTSIVEDAAIGTLLGPIGTGVGATIGLLKSIPRSITAGKSVDKVLKISKTFEKLKSFFKYSKISTKISKFKSYEGKVDDIIEISNDIRKYKQNSILANHLDDIADFMKSKNIGTLEELENHINSKTLKLNDLKTLVAKWSPDDITKLKNTQEIDLEIDEINNIKNKINRLKKLNTPLSDKDRADFLDVVRTFWTLGLFSTGATLGYNYNNQKSIQYVDIMTFEEYHRTCT